MKLNSFSMREHDCEMWKGRELKAAAQRECIYSVLFLFSLAEETCHISDLSMIDLSTKSWHSGKFCVQKLFDRSRVPNESGAYVFVDAPIWPRWNDSVASEVGQCLSNYNHNCNEQLKESPVVLQNERATCTHEWLNPANCKEREMSIMQCESYILKWLKELLCLQTSVVW